MDYKSIIYEKEDHVTTITINRPEVQNALNSVVCAELQHAFKAFRDDEDAYVLIITGAGDKAFTAGWDLEDASEMVDLGTIDQFRVEVLNREGYVGYTRKVDIFKPIISESSLSFKPGCFTRL